MAESKESPKPTAPKTGEKKPEAKKEAKAAAAPEAKGAKAPAKPPAQPAPQAAAKPAGKTEDVKVVERPTPQKHKAGAKPTLTPQLEQRLRLRAAIGSRRPTFRRQQWYEYKRLEDSGWRKPTGVDSAMRRHFGYEQPVVRVGFRGPVETRGLHPSGFEEVYVERVEDLARIDPKRQAARVSRRLGTRNLRLVYAEADKRGVRVLNRRKLE